MRKKIIALIALFVFGCIGQSFAQENVAILELDSTTGKLTCTATLDVAVDTLVTVNIYKPNYNNKNTNKNNFKDAVLYFDIKPYTGEPLVFSTFIQQDDDPAGYYTAEVSAKGLNLIASEPLYFASEKEKEKAVNDLNDALDSLEKAEEGKEDITGVQDVISRKNVIFRLDIESGYEKQPYRIIMNLISCRKLYYDGNFADIAAVNSAWEKSLALNTLNLATSENITDRYKEISEQLGISTDETGDVKSAIIRAISYVKDDIYASNVGYEDLEYLMEKAVALGKVNSATRTSMTDVLEKHKEILDLDLTDYDDVDKVEANKALTDKEFKKIEDVAKALYAKIKKMAETEEPSNNRGGGGFGGGSKIVVEKIVPPTQNVIAVQEFADLSEAAWAKDDIMYLMSQNIVNGKGNGCFEPNSPITREEFLKILLGAFKYDVSLSMDNMHFKDADTSAWYAPYISTAIKHDIVNGISNELFGVGSNITRQDIAVLIHRVISGTNSDNTNLVSGFSDFSQVSDYAASAVASLESKGIINGTENGTFEPKERCTRAAACKIICSSLKYMGMESE